MADPPPMTDKGQTSAVRRIIDSMVAAGEDMADWHIDDPKGRGIFEVEIFLRRFDD